LVTTYFEIAGNLVELENVYQEFTGGRSTSESRKRTREIKSVISTAKTGTELARAIADDNDITWEQVGSVLGFGLGVVQAALTSPLTLVDGVLPIADAAWWAVNAKSTQRYIFTGGKIGSYIDSYADAKPSDLWGNVRPISYSPSWDY